LEDLLDFHKTTSKSAARQEECIKMQTKCEEEKAELRAEQEAEFESKMQKKLEEERTRWEAEAKDTCDEEKTALLANQKLRRSARSSLQRKRLSSSSHLMLSFRNSASSCNLRIPPSANRRSGSNKPTSSGSCKNISPKPRSSKMELLQRNVRN
jgi:hypothetical protein